MIRAPGEQLDEAARVPADVREAPEPSTSRREGEPRLRLVYRHSALVRTTHWINVACLIVLLTSGLQIFNAHPALYWGEISDFDNPVFAITARKGQSGMPRGVTVLAGRELDTTGVLGFSQDGAGRGAARAFPTWATLPSWQSLAEGRLWHFFFAWVFVLNGVVYLLHGLLSRHVWRDITPSRRDLGRIGQTTWDHLRLRFHEGEEATRYNVLQKLSYLAVVFVLLPVLVLAGLAMSPRINAAFPELTSFFGGRQSARTVHFVAAFALVVFVLVHVFMVLISGVWNNMRSMVTGRYAIKTDQPNA